LAEEVILGGATEENSGSEETTILTEPVVDTPDPEGVADTEVEKQELVKDKDSPADTSIEAPDKYEDFEFPEGYSPNPEAVSKATDLFKELNLNQAQAQKLVSLNIEHQKSEQDRSTKAWTDTMAEWKSSASNDKEFGGANLTASLGTAKTAVDSFGSAEFKEMLELTGVGNHPEMVRFLVKVGKVVQDDKILQGSGTTGSPPDPAKRLFPDMN
jgi:hypothetical protein